MVAKPWPDVAVLGHLCLRLAGGVKTGCFEQVRALRPRCVARALPVRERFDACQARWHTCMLMPHMAVCAYANLLPASPAAHSALVPGALSCAYTSTAALRDSSHLRALMTRIMCRSTHARAWHSMLHHAPRHHAPTPLSADVS
eukprot:6185994-Pleurochrysis_carterae.AAC.2